MGWLSEPRPVRYYQSVHTRGSLMKSLKLIGLALGASLALTGAALAEDITIAVAGPMTGGESAIGRQMKNGADMAGGGQKAPARRVRQKIQRQVRGHAGAPPRARPGWGKD